MYVDNSEAITFMEWCAGYGGIGLGLKRIFGERLRTIAYCELEGYAQANLISKMEQNLLDVAPIWSDVKTFPTQEFHGLVDIFSAGYPCQPFSTAGKRLGEKDPRHLWPFIQRAVAVIRPRFCFFENVRGHLTCGFKNVCQDLSDMGYGVKAGLFTAAEVGAPQERKRLYILANSISNRIGNVNRCCNQTERDNFLYSKGRWEKVWGKTIRCNNQVFKWASRPTENPRGEEAPRTKSRLCGEHNGYRKELDRLRLCGNGVVPQTAELAFRTLYKELMEE